MTLTHIFIFVLGALLARLIAGGRWRNSLILIGSVLAVFWLQALSPVRNLDFWLPLLTITITLLAWFLVRPDDTHTLTRSDWLTLAAVIGLMIGIGLLRYIDSLCCLTASRPPQMWIILPAVAIISGLWFAADWIRPGKGWILTAFILWLIVLMIVLKYQPLTTSVVAAARSLMGQSTAPAASSDIAWLGISYIFFRLTHALRDRQQGRLKEMTLQEFINYALFFPTITAGPIDRSQRFLKSYREQSGLSWDEVYDGMGRIMLGIFKKYALADTLALIALNDVSATQTDSAGWLWVMTYAYAFRIFFDFSGYSDIAIGLGRLLGVIVPENFDRPYIKPNLTAFWNSWHITLAIWFRGYFFNPISRGMLQRWKKIPTPILIAIAQITTMILVGAWHGLTWNFLIWGAWHGIGLYVHNRWANLTRTRLNWLNARPNLKRFTDGAAVLVTFHYVVLGWIWFVLTDTDMAWDVLLSLIGMA